MLRGRALGEVPALLRGGLLAAGYPADNIRAEADEKQASLHLLLWARAGDLLVLPVHDPACRAELTELLDELEQTGWRVQTPLPGQTFAAATGPESTAS